MDLRQLRYFIFVADLQSVARASEHLRIAAPAISRTISALEDEVRTPLFERDGRGMHLTAAGVILHRGATQIFRNIELVRQEVMAEGKHWTGDVILGATPSVIGMAGAALIQRCKEELPRVRLRMLEGYSGYLHNWVLTGTVDIAFVNGMRPNSPRLVSECLAVERLFAIGAPDASAVNAGSITLRTLLQSPLLLPSAQNPTRALVDAAAKTLGVPLTIELDIDSVALLKEVARQGSALAVLPFGAVWREVEAGLLAACPIVEPEIRSDLNLIYLADRPPNRVGSYVIDLLIDVLNDIAASGEAHGFVEIKSREVKSGTRRAPPLNTELLKR